MTKAEIRQKVWQTFQREAVARFPGANGRVPNFAGAEQAAQLLREMAVWRRALVVKVNPDAPQLPVRRLALTEGKIVCVMEAPDQKSLAAWFQKMKVPCDHIASVELEGERGVVKDARTHATVIGRVAWWCVNNGLRVCGVCASPLLGPAGNREFFLWLRKDDA